MIVYREFNFNVFSSNCTIGSTVHIGTITEFRGITSTKILYIWTLTRYSFCSLMNTRKSILICDVIKVHYFEPSNLTVFWQPRETSGNINSQNIQQKSLEMLGLFFGPLQNGTQVLLYLCHRWPSESTGNLINQSNRDF